MVKAEEAVVAGDIISLEVLSNVDIDLPLLIVPGFEVRAGSKQLTKACVLL